MQDDDAWDSPNGINGYRERSRSPWLTSEVDRLKREIQVKDELIKQLTAENKILRSKTLYDECSRRGYCRVCNRTTDFFERKIPDGNATFVCLQCGNSQTKTTAI